jgi:hypothetical protein
LARTRFGGNRNPGLWDRCRRIARPQLLTQLRPLAGCRPLHLLVR